jgi:HK97 family phage portal protein
VGRVFQSLGELGEYVGSTGIEIVDAGVPLTEWNADATYGPAWRNQPAVRKVVGFVARALASTPLHVFDRHDDDSRERVRTGPIAELLRRPSRAPGLTPMRLWESLLIDGLLHDKYVAQLIEHNDGYELVRIPARRVRFKNDGLDRIGEVVITGADGRAVERDPKDFLIDVGYSERGTNGTSPLRTLREILNEYNEAISYRRSVHKNGGRFPGAISRPNAFSSDVARERFKSMMSTFTRGGENAGGMPVFEDGETFTSLGGFKPRDIEDLAGRKLTDIEVCTAYYIAPEILGIREGTFANVKAFKEMLYGPNLGPYITAWEQGVNAFLVPRLQPGGDVYVEAAVESKLRGSFEEEAEVLSTASGAPWMTRNEVRVRKNLPAIEGGDELVTPLNVLIGGQSSPQDGVTAGGGGVMPKTAEEIQRLITAATALIRAGFDPQASLAAVGLDPIEHVGLLPVTLREDEKQVAVITKFRDRQKRVVRTQRSAGAEKWWDRGRWDRELLEDLAKAGAEITEAALVAKHVNDDVERELAQEGVSDADQDR